MKRPVSDDRLQDFVDDRLSETERRELEARLLEEPELARRVAAWREIGGALRDPAAELGPDFYVRARERFERTRSRAAWGWSWEALGLVAAVALAGVLFLPHLLRERAPGLPAPTSSEAVPPSARAQADDRNAEGVEVQLGTEAERRDAVSRDRAAEPRSNAKQVAAAPAAPAPPPAAPAPDAFARNALKREADAPREEPARPLLDKDNKKEERLEQAQALGAVSGVAAEADALAEASGEIIDVDAVEVAPAAPEVDGLRIIEDREQWSLWLGPRQEKAKVGAEAEMRKAAADERAERLVVVSAPSGVACMSLIVRRTPEAYRIRLSAGSSAACAFALPSDGLPVKLDEP